MPPSDAMKAKGWIEHDEGPCPVPLDSRPAVMWLMGGISKGCSARTWTADAAPDRQDFWQHPKIQNRIIAYKPEPSHD